MREMFKNCGNPGLHRRFNLDDVLYLDDFTDEQLTTVLKRLIRKEGLRAEPSTIQLAVRLVSQRRRLDNFGNAGEVAQILDRAKVKLAGRGQLT